MARKKKIQCALCGRYMGQITVKHLNLEHPGWSLEKYKRVYGATTPKQLQAAAVAEDVSAPIAKQVVARIMEDKTLLNDIMAKVGEGLFGEKMRGLTVASLMAVLESRMSVLAKAAQNAEAVQDELYEPWRLKEGGENAGPTPTDQLVRMGYLAQGDLQNAIETILRVGQLGVLDAARSDGPTVNVQVYSGAHEKVVLPDNLTPQTRESMRLFVSKITRGRIDVSKVVEKARELRDAKDVPVEVRNAKSDEESDREGSDS